jgi:hypothetical protein
LTLVASGAVFAACWAVAHWLRDTWLELAALDFMVSKRLAITGYRGVRALVTMVFAYFFSFVVNTAVFRILRSLLFIYFILQRNSIFSSKNSIFLNSKN